MLPPVSSYLPGSARVARSIATEALNHATRSARGVLAGTSLKRITAVPRYNDDALAALWVLGRHHSSVSGRDN